MFALWAPRIKKRFHSTRKSLPIRNLASIGGKVVTVALVGYVAACSLIFPTSSVIVNNLSDLTITGVYIAPSTEPEWGDNLLLAPLEPGRSATFSQLEKSVYSVRIMFSDNSYTVVDQVDLTSVEEFVLNVRYSEVAP